MRNVTVALAVLLVASCGGELHAETAIDNRACNSQSAKEVLNGLFIVHQRCGHVLYEIPPGVLDRDMLITTEYTAFGGTEGDTRTSGLFADIRMVRWIRRGDQVHLELVKLEMRADEGRRELTRAIQRASPAVPLRTFDVLSEGKDAAPVIDVTSLFLSDLHTGLAPEIRHRLRMVQVDSQLSYIRGVKVFPQNIEVSFSQTWNPDPKDLAAEAPQPGEHTRILFHASMVLLPKQPMQGRFADTRIGYLAESFNDFGSTPPVRRGFIQRYRLEKKDPAAEVSEPVTPIVFYLAREVPERWRPYIKRGIEDWQVVFEKSGFRNAIIARDAPTPTQDANWDPEDARYSTIRWAPGQDALGAGIADPRSGECISSHVILWYSVFKSLEDWYFSQVAPLDKRAQRLPLADDLMGELLRYVVSHEIGHALGLRHNFKAHSAYSVAQLRSKSWTERWGTSASIMSYARFNYVAQPGDNAAVIPKFGPYDYFAIEWGYKPLPGLSFDQEWDVLDRFAARQVDEPMLRFGGEDEAAELDPTVMVGVVGSDPIEAGQLGLRNLDRAAGLLVKASTQKGRDYSRLAELYAALVAQRHHELLAVAKLIGGVVETRNQAQRGAAPFEPVSPQRQRDAAMCLVDRAFVRPAPLLDPEILRRIGPGSGDALRASNRELLARLIDAAAFQRMAAGQATLAQTEKYVGADLIRDLNRGLFSELDATRPAVGLYRRDLQRAYVHLLVNRSSGQERTTPRASNEIEAVLNRLDWKPPQSHSARHDAGVPFPFAEATREQRRDQNAPSEFRAALRAGVQDLALKIKTAAKRVKDDETALHLSDLLFELNRAR